MSECVKVKKLLSRYADQETGQSDTALVKLHLGHCSFCQKELAGLTQIKGLISGKAKKNLPQDYLVCRLREKIAAEQYIEEKPSWIAGMGNLSRRLIPVPATAVLLSLVLLILSSQQQASSYSLDEQVLDGVPTTIGTAAGLILGV